MTAFLESWGTGVSRMVEACKAVGLPEPEYGTDGGFVWITFKRPNSVTNSVTNTVTNTVTNSVTNSDTNSDTNNNITQKLSDKQKEILAYCIIPRSSREILEHIGVTYHNHNITKYIKRLINMELLERTIPDTPNNPRQKYVIKKSTNNENTD